MSRRGKSTIHTWLRYIILIIVIIALVIFFNATKNDNTDLTPATGTAPATDTTPATGTTPATNIDPVPPATNIPPKTDDQPTIIGGSDKIDVNQSSIYGAYIVTSSNTEYHNSGWKYFIIRSYTEFKKYFDNYFVAEENYEINEEVENFKNSIDTTFFKENCIILIVDYSSKEINSTIESIELSDSTATINIKRNSEESTNNSKFITHILPIASTQIKTIKTTYIK